MKTFAVCLIALLAAIPARGQWQYGGKVISGPNYGTDHVTAISDGFSGVFVAWQYNPHQFDPDIYVQHIDSAGYELWPHEGLPAEIEPHGQYSPCMVSDGHGGVIVAWSDLGRNGSNYDIYAQRLDSTGQRLWGDTGIPVVFRGGHQMSPQMVSDGQGGAILAWSDDYWAYTDTMPVMIQRVDSTGAILWGEYGRGVTPLRSGIQSLSGLLIASDGNFIACWADGRTDGAGPGIYAQKFMISGNLLWAENGTPIILSSGDISDVHYSVGPAGGLYSIWTSSIGMFFQYLESSGQARFGAGGLIVDINGGNYLQLITTSDGQALMLWQHFYPWRNIYANVVDTMGSFYWAENPIIATNVYSINAFTQSTPGIFEFYGEVGPPNYNLGAFKYSITDGHQWGDTGVCINCYNCPFYRGIGMTDMLGGIIPIWQQSQYNVILINRVYPDGWVPTDVTEDNPSLPGLVSLSNYPNPFNSGTNILVEGCSGREVEIGIYNIEGRLICKLSTNSGGIIWNARNMDDEPVPSGIYFARMVQSSGAITLKMTCLK